MRSRFSALLTQSTHRKARLEPAIGDAQKLAQNVFPPSNCEEGVQPRSQVPFVFVTTERERHLGLACSDVRWTRSPQISLFCDNNNNNNNDDDDDDDDNNNYKSKL